MALISHIYLEKRYRAKLRYLAEMVDLRVISPQAYPFPYGLYQADFSEERAYSVRAFPCRFPAGVRTSTRWILASRDLSLREFQPDIIHVENEIHSFSLLQAVLTRRVYAPRAQVIAFGWANQWPPGLQGRLLDGLSRFIRPRVDHFIVGNSAGQDLLAERGVPRERQSLIPAVGLDLDYFQPASPAERAERRAALGLRPDEFVVGFVGRFVPAKGLPDLLAAVLQLNGQPPARLLCVGDGPLKAELAQYHPQVLTVSPGGGGGVLPYYQAMDVLVLPSRSTPRWQEQFGLVLTEAMACGIPVLGSSSGAIPEVIGEAGLVFHEGDVSELASCLHSLACSAPLRAQLAEAGRRRAAGEYSDQVIARRTFGVYQEQLEANPR